MKKPLTIAVCAGVVATVAVGGSAWWWQARQQETANRQAQSKLTYSGAGYGGFSSRSTVSASPLPVVSPTPVTPTVAASSVATVPVSEPLRIARAAYAKGDYKATEQAAKAVVATATGNSLSKLAMVQVASAQHLLAFAAARQGDLKTARTRFAKAREDAETLPVSPKNERDTPSQMGAPIQATLAEDAAYQHAACTMGLGDKAGAEREYVQFLRDFPESPLVHGSMRRIARLHGGDIPKSVEAVWKNAQVIQRKAQEERERQAAMCAPDCLAYLLGSGENVENLAKEMRTGGDGTTLAALVASAKRHGYRDAQGVRLTKAGLKKQTLPLIALVQPGHFVVVTKADTAGVTVWDSNPRPFALGQSSKGGTKHKLPWREWGQSFGSVKSGSGVAVIGLGKRTSDVISSKRR